MLIYVRNSRKYESRCTRFECGGANILIFLRFFFPISVAELRVRVFLLYYFERFNDSDENRKRRGFYFYRRRVYMYMRRRRFVC